MNKKECKGINKAFGYDGCGKLSDYRKFGLCPYCLYDWMTNSENGKIYYLKQFKPKVNNQTKKRNKEKEKKDRDKITNYRNLLQTKIQLICRLIDIGLPCLARNYHPKQMHGGHVFAKGGNKTMALNLHNIHRQSAQSNKWQNDDGLLREGLQKEYGIEYFNFISELRRLKALKYSNIEYKEFYIIASKIALKLKKQGDTFSLIGRIDQRNKINIELGIYSKEYCIFKP